MNFPVKLRRLRSRENSGPFSWDIFNSKPYEVFGGLSKYVDIPNKYKMGKIAKNGKVDDITTYNLIVG